MELYHGSYTKVEQPHIIKGQYTKDFGTGFYCTILKEQAERWARRKAALLGKEKAIISVYEMKENTAGLKVKSFAPEFVGKLNFYVNAVDELIKSPNESPTLGLLICRDKDDTEVQWAFKGVNTPLGVATYENIEIKEIQEYLPSTEQIRERIAVAEQEFLMNAREQTKAEGEDGNK